jgi:carbonic anhydrase
MKERKENANDTSRRAVLRREILGVALGASVGFASGWLLRDSRTPRATRTTVDDGLTPLRRLQEGNARFVEGAVRHSHENRTWRAALTADQHPFAIILGCSDSRVPIELLFDQGFGDLFVIRVAGNVISPDVVGSIAYAIAHLHARLLVVLGHEGCGAVTAALHAGEEAEPRAIESLVDLIGPGLRKLPSNLQGEARVRAAVEANVRWSMGQLAAIPTGRRILDRGELTMVGAVYELTTGKVNFLES